MPRFQNTKVIPAMKAGMTFYTCSSWWTVWAGLGVLIFQRQRFATDIDRGQHERVREGNCHIAKDWLIQSVADVVIGGIKISSDKKRKRLVAS